jgi:hypothetical protein
MFDEKKDLLQFFQNRKWKWIKYRHFWYKKKWQILSIHRCYQNWDWKFYSGIYFEKKMHWLFLWYFRKFHLYNILQGLWNVIIFSVSFRSVSQTFVLRTCKFVFVPFLIFFRSVSFRFIKNNVPIFRFRKNNVLLFRFVWVFLFRRRFCTSTAGLDF